MLQNLVAVNSLVATKCLVTLNILTLHFTMKMMNTPNKKTWSSFILIRK